VALFVMTISSMFLVLGVLAIFVGEFIGLLIVLPTLLAIAWGFMVKRSMPVRACNECGYQAYGHITGTSMR
jgi:cytochrome c biogenesis protein CcdA